MMQACNVCSLLCYTVLCDACPEPPDGLAQGHQCTAQVFLMLGCLRKLLANASSTEVISCCRKTTTTGPCTLAHIEASSAHLGLSTSL